MKNIPDIPGYSITTTGDVWSEPKGTSNPKGKWLSKQVDKDGYYRVALVCKDGKRRGLSIHRLVAMTYIDNPLNYKQVNHIDGNKQNNNVDNLEWVTTSMNRQHAYDTNLQKATQGIIRKDNTSGYVGVWARDGYWIASISHNRLRYNIGKFYTPESAARAYNLKAVELFGDNARLNVIKEADEEANTTIRQEA